MDKTPKPTDLTGLTDDLYASLLHMNLRPEEHKQTIDLLRKKGWTDAQIKDFLAHTTPPRST